MSADTIISRLSSAECETIAERFIQIMFKQDAKREVPKATISRLCELYRDAEQWAVDDSSRRVIP